MGFPLGKKSLLVILPLVAATVYWRVRNGRRDERWSDDVDAAADEGIAAARAPAEPPAG